MIVERLWKFIVYKDVLEANCVDARAPCSNSERLFTFTEIVGVSSFVQLDCTNREYLSEKGN